MNFVNAGGAQPDDAILPTNLSEQLAVCASDTDQSYVDFKDFVIAQTSQILMNRGGIPE